MISPLFMTDDAVMLRDLPLERGDQMWYIGMRFLHDAET